MGLLANVENTIGRPDDEKLGSLKKNWKNYEETADNNQTQLTFLDTYRVGRLGEFIYMWKAREARDKTALNFSE